MFVKFLNSRSRTLATTGARFHASPTQSETDVKDSQSLVGGVLGLAGAPTFQRGENIVALLKRDHKRVDDLASDYNRATSIEKRREIARELTKDLVQHSEVEQLLVYPLLKMRGETENKQQGMHDRSLQEHQQIRELLYDLDQTSVDDPSHKDKLNRVMDAVQHHVKEEEEQVIPILEKNYSSDELERLGNAFEKHKYTATTRPHPNAPAQGPLAAAANIVSKAYDMARDAVENITGGGAKETTPGNKGNPVGTSHRPPGSNQAPPSGSTEYQQPGSKTPPPGVVTGVNNNNLEGTSTGAPYTGSGEGVDPASTQPRSSTDSSGAGGAAGNTTGYGAGSKPGSK